MIPLNNRQKGSVLEDIQKQKMITINSIMGL